VKVDGFMTLSLHRDHWRTRSGVDDRVDPPGSGVSSRAAALRLSPRPMPQR